jgi:hypothetical protein
MSNARTVDFFRLPKDTRERFVGCVTGAAAPAPLLQVVPALGTGIFWRVVLCLVVVGGLAWLGYNGFGEIGDSWMLQSVWVLPLYVGLLWLGANAILGAARSVVLRRALPFPPGKYLFPLDLVDAQTKDVRILPLGSLESTRMVEHQNEGAYTHTAFELHYEGGEHHTFNVNNQVAAAMTASAIESSREAIRAAIEKQDMLAIAGMDVFIEPRLDDNWQVEAPAGPSPGRLPVFLARWRLAALAAAVVVAIPLWHLRNVRSDDLGFAGAIAWTADGGPGFETYLRDGRRHVDKVRRTFLPRAAIHKAQKEGSLMALDLLVEIHKGTPLEAEAREAREAVLTEIAMRADRERDLKALRAFLVDHPGSRLDGQVRGSIARLYGLAKERYHAQGSAAPAVVGFMDKLFDRLGEVGSPEVAMRFERRPEGLGDAEWRHGEAALVEGLNREFVSALGPDAGLFIDFQHEAGAPQSSPRPVVLVAYQVAPSGRGQKVDYVVTLHLPGDEAAKLSLQHTATTRGGGAALDADSAFHALRFRLGRFLFDNQKAFIGRLTILPPKPVAPIRLPTRLPWAQPPALPWQ